MTLTQNRYRISSVVAKRSILLLVLSVVPITIVHESGHFLFCEVQGYQAKITLEPLAMKTFCNGLPANLFLYYFMGGGLACIIATALAVSFRKHKAILIACLTVAVGQFVTAIVETFLHDFYVEQFWVPVLSYLVFLPLLVKIGKNTYNTEYKPVPIPKFLKSTRLMIALIGVIAFLVIFVDTVTTAYFLSHYKYGVLAEDNLLARMLISSTGFALILGIKTLGVSAMTFVSYLVSRVKRYLPLVNIGLAVVLLVFIYVASNNLYLVLKLLLR